MPKVKVGDINMYYEIHGEGEPIVMINGAGGTVDWVRRLIPVYSREYRLILFDNRGAGQSDKPDMAYTTAMLADDLAGLLDAIGIDSAHVRGVSFGGMIAQEFALRHPEKVRSLVLMVTSCGQPHSIMSSSADLSKAHELPPKEATEALLRCFITEEFIEKQPRLFQTLIAFALEHPIDPDCLAKHTDAIKHHDTYDRLPKISVPTLVIGGDADTVIPAENARILASRIPRAELVILKNAGHMLIEAAQEADRLTLDFLKRHQEGV
jgi:pimeloyl-ACP methyl ester carboxylesterase